MPNSPLVQPLLASRWPSWHRFVACAAVSLGVHTVTFLGLGRAARDRLTPTFDPTSQTLEGDTLDVDPRAPLPTRIAASSLSVSRQVSGPPEEDLVGATVPRAAPRPSPAHEAHEARRIPGPPPSPPAALYGAVGARAATDVATAFTRAFPQAASADSLWLTVPFGPAGVADISLVLDDAGTLVASRVDGTPSPALRRGIARTIALLGTRLFTAHAPVTRLRVVAHVGRDDVHDGLHGEVFALSGGSFAGDVGSAFFALPAGERGGGGRRVDVSLHLAPGP